MTTNTIHKLNKLYTYTDKSLIKRTPNEILVYVYAKAELSKDMEELRKYPRSEVTPYPIAIEVRFPVTASDEQPDQLLAGAEALAQVAAVSPEFFNIFGTKKGVNITDLMLVASQPILIKFAQFIKEDLSTLCIQYLSMASVFFYGVVSRLMQDGERDWVEPLLSGKEAPYAIYNTSLHTIFDRFCIENSFGKFFVTRLAIEDFLSLPHRFKGVDAVTRPFKAIRGVFGQKFKEPIPGSSLAPQEPYNESGLRNKVFLAPGLWRVRLEIVEDEIFGEPVYIVKKMPPYMTKSEINEYRKNGTDQFTNSAKIRDHIRAKQKMATDGLLG